MYSPNMLKTFQTCPQKYYLKYVEQIIVPQKASFFEKGKKIHALANYFLKGCDITKLEKTLTSEESQIWENLKSNEYFQKTYVNSEYNISGKIGDFWISGRLDAIVKDESTYYILDYKTGAIPKNPEYDVQTIVYMLCLYKLICNSDRNDILSSAQNDCKPQNLIKFVYIDLKNNKNHIIELTSERKKEYEQIIINICQSIKNVQPEVEHSKICEFCEYRKICN